MSNEVLKIGTDGTVCQLRPKKGGYNAVALGHAKIRRVTTIEWNETKQAFYIAWTEDGAQQFDKIAGAVWGETFLTIVPDYDQGNLTTGKTGVLWFDDYEEANAFEIEVIRALQVMD